MNVVVVGKGRVGTTLAQALAVPLVSSRNLPMLSAGAFVIAVRDSAIADVARAILAQHPDALLFHTAGGVPSSVLRDAGAREAAVMHPLIAFADATPPELKGALFAIEGDQRAVVAAESLVHGLGGRTLRLEAAQMARYHAAAALASNHVLGLVDEARQLMEGLGAERALAQAGLARLFETVAHNLSALGLPEALTGPIARGDVAMVRRHLDALPEAARVVYATTGLLLCTIAERRGVAAQTDIAAIRALLLLYAPAAVD